jgi:hypothetical protein
MMMKKILWMIVGHSVACCAVLGQVIQPGGGGGDVELTAELIAAAGGVTNGQVIAGATNAYRLYEFGSVDYSELRSGKPYVDRVPSGLVVGQATLLDASDDWSGPVAGTVFFVNPMNEYQYTNATGTKWELTVASDASSAWTLMRAGNPAWGEWAGIPAISRESITFPCRVHANGGFAAGRATFVSSGTNAFRVAFWEDVVNNFDALGAGAGAALDVEQDISAHTNLTLTGGAHGGMPTAAQVGAVATNGGTLTGPLLTTLDHVTTPPGDYELPSARWVRGLAMAGSECYFTPTITNGFGNKTTNFVLLSETLPAALFTNSIASPVASSTYIAGGIFTNLRTAIRSTITIDAWLARVGGSSASTIPIFGEIYYIYAGTTNHLGDWSVGPLYLTDTNPQHMQWVVAFNEPTVTGAVQIIGYLKTGTVSGPAAGVNIYGGGQYSSHMDIQAAASEYTLTAAAIAAAGGATTQDISYAAAPFCYQVTLTNTAPLAFTNNWSPTQSISRITATSTGTVTFVMNWPSSQIAYWGFCYDATGMPSTVFPAGAIYFTSGVFSNTTPSLSNSNFVSVMHSCATYQIMAFTNTVGTWGTP